MDTPEKNLLRHTLIMRSEQRGVLCRIKNTILDSGIDESIYHLMKRDIADGNFDVIYLDERLVTDKKRASAKKDLDLIRRMCLRLKNEGKSNERILTY